MTDSENEVDLGLPARLVATGLDWSDLVLDAKTQADVETIAQWVRHEKTLLEDWNLARHLKPGYRAAFLGPPGTGKTLAACLLGKTLGLDVYRIDLVSVPALDALFARATAKHWILLVDGNVIARVSDDRAANQQIAYLLQRIEDYPVVVILESNVAEQLDDAFARRFQSVIRFAVPDSAARLRLWKYAFAGQHFGLADDVDLQRIALEHEISGADIIAVLRFAALRAVARDPAVVSNSDIVEGLAALPRA